MNDHLRFNKTLRLAAIVIGMFMLLSSIVYSKDSPRDTEVDMLRFDAILELNAPIIRTHVILFVRYWVAPDYYSASIVWAEPHVGSLNFPVYPMTLNINSNRQYFSLSNQVNTWVNSLFPKPIGKRGVFRYMFNNYPLPNIRFAEPEAQALRIYRSDLEQLTGKSEGNWQTIELQNPTNDKVLDREVAQLKVRTNRGRIDAMNLLDAKGQLIKSIEYEYSQKSGRQLLRRQNVVLPERPLIVVFKGEGIRIKLDGEERNLKQLPTSHHKGKRNCTINYQPLKLGDKLVSVPAHISVHRVDNNMLLRSARMFNFVHLKLGEQKSKEAAEQFGRFGSDEMKCRELLLKYWLKDPDQVQDADVEVLRQLQNNFERLCVGGKTAGEQLKRINLLLELDLMLGDDVRLQKHFEEYLAILIVNDLNQMTLVGGQHMIDTTVRWNQFRGADQLLQKWVDTVLAVNNPDSILGFGETEIRRGRIWSIVRLIEKAFESHRVWGPNRFEAQALRCMSLYKLYEMIKEPDYIKSEHSIAEAGWVSWSIGTENLFKILNESLGDAKRLFADLDEPTRKHKVLKGRLDTIEQKIKEAKN